MSNFFIQNKVTNKIIDQISEKMFCEVYPKNPRKPNGIAQRYNRTIFGYGSDRESSGRLRSSNPRRLLMLRLLQRMFLVRMVRWLRCLTSF